MEGSESVQVGLLRKQIDKFKSRNEKFPAGFRVEFETEEIFYRQVATLISEPRDKMSPF